jgi:hypothetical protein
VAQTAAQQNFQNTPGYQFALKTGGQAVRNADTPGVGALSGAALKDLTNFNVGTANQYYGQYFNQFQTQQNNIFNRLNTIATLGSNAGSNSTTGASQFSNSIGNTTASIGASQAAGTVGAGKNKAPSGASRGVSSSASVGGGSVMSGSASVGGGGIHASRKVSFDETSVFSGSASVHTAHTAPPAFHRHSPFKVIEPFRAEAPRQRSYTRDAGDGDGGNGDGNGGGGSPPSRVDLLRRRYADTARSLSKSASAVTKTAANARDTMAERLTSLREGLGKGLSFRSSSQ